MRTTRALLGVLLLLLSTVPARADFKYTETSQVTGGALIKMMKFGSIFARGDAKKQEQQALQPTTTTHYVSGNRLRTDQADGTAQIIDLDGQRVISIDLNQKTYAVATFDQIKAAMAQAQQQLQQQQAQMTPEQKQQLQDAQIKLTPKIHVTPGGSNRVILSQPTNETKVDMDLAMQVTATGQNAPPPGQPNSGTLDTLMSVDTYVAPGVSGYEEFAKFYRRMAQQVDWLKIPAMNVQIDPRMDQGMAELRKNSDALKGFPLLSYVSMSMAATADGQQPASGQTSSQSQPPATPPPSQPQTSSSSSSNSIPDSPSAAVMKLGGFFGKKKSNNSSSSNQDASGGSQSSAPPPNPNANPNALLEMTTQVTSFSDSSLDGSLFDIPAGYTQIQEDPSLVMAGRRAQAAPQPKK